MPIGGDFLLPVFELKIPRTLEELWEIKKKEDRANILAGGTDLLIDLQQNPIPSEVLIDITKIPEFQEWEENEKTISFGAAITHNRLATKLRQFPFFHGIAQGAMSIGSNQIRNVATVGGNICNAVPSADIVPPLLVSGAVVLVISPRGKREVKLADFFLGPRKTILEKDEVLQKLILPIPAEKTITRYYKFSPRDAMDLAVVGVGVFMSRDRGNQVSKLRVSLGAVGPTPIILDNMEEIIERKTWTGETLKKCGEFAQANCIPISDIRAGEEYRKEIVGILTCQAIRECYKEFTGVKI